MRCTQTNQHHPMATRLGLVLLLLAACRVDAIPSGGYLPLRLCPSVPSLWVGVPKAMPNSTCPAGATSSSQVLQVQSLAMAQSNSQPSGVYVLAVLRSPAITKADITIEVTDANGKVWVPKKVFPPIRDSAQIICGRATPRVRNWVRVGNGARAEHFCKG